jgi:hypothetical protein
MFDSDSLHQHLVNLLAGGAGPDDLRDAVEGAIEAAITAGVIPAEEEEDEPELEEV